MRRFTVLGAATGRFELKTVTASARGQALGKFHCLITHIPIFFGATKQFRRSDRAKCVYDYEM